VWVPATRDLHTCATIGGTVVVRAAQPDRHRVLGPGVEVKSSVVV